MELLLSVLNTVSGWVWGVPTLALILLVGIWLTVIIRGVSITRIPFAFVQLIKGRSANGEGTVAPFSALMMSLSATIGTGNIAGVATAIGLGGPGALFWMWCSALFGMATKYAEAVCAVHYREKNAEGKHVGGPMYYIKNGLGKRWLWLAACFAFFGSIAGFGIGNMVQANSVADSLADAFGVNRVITAFVLMILVGAVIWGGVTRIATVAKKLVPLMALSYLVAGVIVLGANFAEIPAAIALVFKSAFSPVAAQGGFAGAAVALAIEKGIARGVFSNEAGLGSAPIAHAAAATDSPVRQGTIAMLGTFIDTLIVCSITGLAIIVSGVWTGTEQGAAMSQAAFNSVLPYGDKIVSVALVLFAFTTIIGWSYYGERCVEYLFGRGAIRVFRYAWVVAIPVGVMLKLEVVWIIADILNGLMALPNLVALLLLSGVVAKLTREFYASNKVEKAADK
ncbi:alanine/glycine:cation symporter family protein [Saccharophagus degradans]|uniref:Sodium:alanine symporter family protein n=1 Tax=Saccharophagus degradans TaxID=86304 RepID=A0AAW7X973_9GAMM|nr:sodium:alanine symporter family protein [Saccharophagus degradans]MDO6424266.1 sodium:alanine symporter family protein [Saccharophagus degradans]MDO6608313.1 sodium:alanine symporter family protein [Saccharophagus degradans]WGO96841.1 sodium:alanine symporter family protein [Saccharophagus degradans]